MSDAHEFHTYLRMHTEAKTVLGDCRRWAAGDGRLAHRILDHLLYARLLLVHHGSYAHGVARPGEFFRGYMLSFRANGLSAFSQQLLAYLYSVHNKMVPNG